MNSKSTRTRRKALILASSIATLALGSKAMAASGTWVAAPTSADWNTTANWTAAFPNATTDIATFSNALSGTIGSAANPITLSASINLQNIVFTGSAGAYSIGAVGGANTITLRGTGTASGGSGATFNNSISIAASGTNSEVINTNLLFSAPSSTSIGYNFLNNSTTSTAKLTIAGNIDTRTATNRFTSVSLDGSNVGDNVISGVITSGAGTTQAGQGNILLVKNGTGRWILSGANVFSGAGITAIAQGIQINAGTLSAQNNQAFGTTGTANANQVNINSGGTLEIANAITLDNGVSLNLNSGGTIRSSGSTTTNGRINIAAAATAVTISTTNSTDVFTVGNGTNDFTGGTAGITVATISGPGTVLLNTASNYVGSFSLNAGSLRLGSPTALGAATTATVGFGASSSGKLQLFGNSATLVGLNTNATVGAATLENGAAAAATLTLNNATANTFGGVLQNGAGGALVLVKQGAGALTLSGNSNTYSGGTTISGGSLRVINTSGSATGSGSLTLQAATLTGAGLISGSVTTTATSTLTPGTVTAGLAGSGVLTLGNLSLTTGTTLNYGLVSGNANNNYISTGTLTLPGSGVVLDLYAPGTSNPFAAAGTYNLFQYSTLAGVPLSNSSFSFGTSIAGYNASFGVSGGFLQLTLTAAGVIGNWTNGNATNNWSEAGNWSGGVPSVAGDSAVFNSAPGVVNLDANETVGGLTFNNAAAYTVSGASTLTLDNTGSGVAVGVVAGSHVVGTALTFSDNVTVSASSGAQLTLSGNISQGTGSSILTKTGTGTLVLSGTNAYSGGTVVSAGALNFNGLSALGSGATLALGSATTGGTLQYASGNTADVSGLTVTLNAGGGTIDTNGNNVTFANPIGNNGSGPLVKNGIGTLTLGGANSYTGTTTINNGTVSISSNANLGPAATAAQLIFTGTGAKLATTASFGLFNGAAGTNDRTIAINGTNGTLAPANATTLTVSGAITGGGRLIKEDAGTLAIQNPVSLQNTYSGGTLISAGRVTLGDINSNVQGLGTGTVTLDGGTLQLFSNGAGSNDAGNFANNVVVDTGFTGTLIGMGRGTIGGTLTGAGTLNYQTDYLRAQLSGNWSGFTGQINFTPNTNGGDFRINNLSGFGTARINLANGVNFSIINNFGAGGVTLSIGELTGGTTSFLGGGPTAGRVATWSVGGANTSAQFSGTIRDGGTNGSGTGITAITKVGNNTWTLTGNNTYTGATLVSAGTLQIGNGSITGSALTNTSGVTVNSIGTLSINLATGETFGNAVTNNGTVNAIAGGTNTLSGAIGGSGTFNQAGAGTTILSGSNGYTGLTTVTTGILNIQNSSALGSTTGGTNVVSGATLQVQGGISIGAEALSLNGGAAAGQTGALVNVNGANAYGGAITVVASSAISALSGTTLAVAGGVVNTGTTATFKGGGAINVNTVGISGTGTSSNLVVDDSGTNLTLNAASTYGGATTVQGGATITGGVANALPVATALTVNTGGTYNLNGFDQLLALLSGDTTAVVTNSVAGTLSTLSLDSSNNASFDGVISGNLALVKTGNGTQTLSKVNTYTGGTQINGGVLALSGVGTLGSTVAALSVSSTGALDLGTTSQTAGAVTLASGGSISNGTLTGSSFTSSGGSASAILAGSGAVFTNTASTTALSGANTYTGGTFLNGGTVIAGHDSALGTGVTTFNGGALASDNSSRTLANTLMVNNTMGNNITGTNGVTLTGGASGSGTFKVNLSSNSVPVIVNSLATDGFAPSAINITSGTLLLAGNEKIGNATDLVLNGGIFNTGGFSESLGNLTLSANSTIDFGAGNTSILTFTGGTWTNGTLTILNWNGAPALPGPGGGEDMLRFTSTGGISQDFLDHISFDGYGAGSVQFDQGSGTFEVVPVPEPTTILGGLVLLGLIGYRERRRLGALRKQFLPN